MGRTLALVLMCYLVAGGALAASSSHPAHTRRATAHRRSVQKRKLVHKAEWSGAGAAAGHVAGPAGSAAVGVVHYRKDLKAGGRRQAKATAKIGAPIAAGAVGGPVGTVGYAAGYEGYKHRRWIKRHILRQKPKPHRVRKSPRR